MGSSLFKKAHKTHAFAQPAGVPYPTQGGEGPGPSRARGNSADNRVLWQFAELCARVSDPAARATLLGVSTDLEAAWQRGEKLPLLRARRKLLERALRSAGS